MPSDGDTVRACTAILIREGSTVIGYCVKCKERRDIQDAPAVTMKNGRAAIKGTCGECGTTMFRIGKAS